MYCKNGVKLKNCKLVSKQDHSLIYLVEPKEINSLWIQIAHDSVVYIGKNCFFNGSYNDYSLSLHVGEGKNIIIGDDCLFSFGIHLRTADPHLIYDAITKKRINESKSIYIGDLVWLAQNSLILKGTQIGSGSIIGGQSVISNKTLTSNCSYAGVPARKIRDSIFFLHDSANAFSVENKSLNETYDSDEFIYQEDEYRLSFTEIENHLSNLKTIRDKKDYLQEVLENNHHKNRFSISKN